MFQEKIQVFIFAGNLSKTIFDLVIRFLFNSWFILIILFLIGSTFLSCTSDISEEVKLALRESPERINYNEHVKPILSDRCFSCHGNDKNKLKANLRLDEERSAKSKLTSKSGRIAIVPKNRKKSELFHRILSDDIEQQMPPPDSKLSLSNAEKAILIKWIDQGAKYEDHWAFEVPVSPAIPNVKDNDWPSNEIDYYILGKLEEKGWVPNEKSSQEENLRRLSFDLTGLPPTIDEINLFVNDKSDNAYEKVVDRLLGSPQYGERMAVDWMDLSRFSDTHGYTVDRFRDMSPWRDWIIKSFNENMPYDDFVIWQLAGDLMPNASDEQILATAFNRNHSQNMEGGIIDEEFRVEYVADRTNTFGTAFLGLTLECARCHDHKYDPISQKEYFELFAFFNNVNEAGQISFDNAPPVPTLILSNQKVDSIVSYLDQKILDKEDILVDLLNTKVLHNKEEVIKTILNPETIAELSFENNLIIKSKTYQNAVVKQQHAGVVKENYVDGHIGKALKLDGDSWVDLNGIGAFSKDEEFSVSLWIYIPESLSDGVIFHKGEGAALYNYRGFHVALKSNKLEVLMAKTWPDNAIIKYGPNVPKNQWVNLTLTYDGSSKAKGLRLYLDGNEVELNTHVDNLRKDILFGRNKEPGIQIGARWRGVGLKNALVDEVKIFDKDLTDLEILKIAGFEDFLIDAFEPVYNTIINEYINSNKKEVSSIRKELDEIRKKKTEAIDSLPEIMVMNEMPNLRKTFVLNRGVYNDHGIEVEPYFPKLFAEIPDSFPRNRLGLAQWLFHPGNPLSSRVLANRIWQQFFGKGLVTTTVDFGNQGSMPTNRELLDFLATEIQSTDWDLKSIIKKIVMSSTYRQSSIASDDKILNDPDNVFLARGPSERLTAEMIRDNALSASGLLHKKIGGPSVKPYQPEGLWAINGTRYIEDKNESLYRRGLYTFWRRTVPNPTQGIFDAPDRSSCVITRQKTNTPLQTLVLFNDPVFVEAAVELGFQISSNPRIEEGISISFKKLTGREIEDIELNLYKELFQSEHEKFKAHPEKMKGWLTAGNFRKKGNQSNEILAACAVVASTMLNSDATIYKR